jgi:hypothetical protein
MVTLSPATIEVALAENEEPVALGQGRTVIVTERVTVEQSAAPLAVSVYVVVVVGDTVALPLAFENVPTPEMLTLVALGTFQERCALIPGPITL